MLDPSTNLRLPRHLARGLKRQLTKSLNGKADDLPPHDKAKNPSNREDGLQPLLTKLKRKQTTMVKRQERLAVFP